MALLHHATIVPTKAELVAAWLPTRPWAPPDPIAAGVSYRLDDPAGEVGLEAFLLTDTGGVTVHVPLTYRAAPLAGAEPHLLGTLEHSVLGTRWVYDGCADPVWAATLAATVATGGAGAEELFAGDEPERREPAVTLRGSGATRAPVTVTGPWTVRDDASTSTVSGPALDLVVVRRVGADPRCPWTATATWDARTAVVAGLRPT